MIKKDKLYEQRIANDTEISEMARFIAEQFVEETYSSEDLDLVFPPRKISKEEYFKIDYDENIKNINGIAIVVEFFEYEGKIYTANITSSHKNDKYDMISYTVRIFKDGEGKMSYLDDDQTYFNLKDQVVISSLKKAVKNSGRPNKPTEASINNTLNVRNFLKAYPDSSIDQLCNDFNIAKSTYYRVSKWLSINSPDLFNKL